MDALRVLKVRRISVKHMVEVRDVLIVLIGLIVNLVVKNTMDIVLDALREFFLTILGARSLEVKPKKSKYRI